MKVVVGRAMRKTKVWHHYCEDDDGNPIPKCSTAVGSDNEWVAVGRDRVRSKRECSRCKGTAQVGGSGLNYDIQNALRDEENQSFDDVLEDLEGSV